MKKGVMLFDEFITESLKVEEWDFNIVHAQWIRGWAINEFLELDKDDSDIVNMQQMCLSIVKNMNYLEDEMMKSAGIINKY